MSTPGDAEGVARGGAAGAEGLAALGGVAQPAASETVAMESARPIRDRFMRSPYVDLGAIVGLRRQPANQHPDSVRSDERGLGKPIRLDARPAHDVRGGRVGSGGGRSRDLSSAREMSSAHDSGEQCYGTCSSRFGELRTSEIFPVAAPEVIADATAAGEALGESSRISAAAPATCGDAIDVPEIVRVV